MESTGTCKPKSISSILTCRLEQPTNYNWVGASYACRPSHWLRITSDRSTFLARPRSEWTMSSVSGNCNFQRPSKLIVGFDTLEQFSKSKTRAELVLFIEVTCVSRLRAINIWRVSHSKEISDSLKLQDVGCEAGCFVREILGFIKKLKNSAQERSELTQVRRYGDVSFREWYARLQKESNGACSLSTNCICFHKSPKHF